MITALLPPWLRRTNGAKFIGVIEARVTTLIELAGQAANVSRLPLVACPDDALPWIGNERRLQKHPGESFDSYRARLQNAWTIWQNAGSSTAIISAFDAFFGATGTTVYASDFWHWESINHPVTGTLWWSRIKVLVPYTTWGGTIDDAGQDALWSIAQKLKSVRYRLDGIVLRGAGDPPLIGVDFIVGQSAVGGSESLVIYGG